MTETSPRLAQLEAWVKEKPGEPFVRYALALELKGLGRTDDAVREFQELVAKHPGYVPTYLMFGNLLITLGREDEAREVLVKGQDAARAAGNQHAVGEIEDALGGLS